MADQERALRLLNFAIDTAFETNCELVKLPVTVAIEIEDLLAEQERVKPTKNQSLFANFIGWNCGACAFPLLSDGYKYCPRCGRRVDWNDEP